MGKLKTSWMSDAMNQLDALGCNIPIKQPPVATKEPKQHLVYTGRKVLTDKGGYDEGVGQNHFTALEID